MSLQIDTQKIGKVCRQYGISYLGLFGSQARGEASLRSDIDLLVRYSPTSEVRSLLDHLQVQLDLGSLFGKNVDLVEEEYLKPQVRPYVMKDLKPIYESA